MTYALKNALWFLIGGLAGGVYFREMTKWNGYEGATSLSSLHPHLIVLGALVPILFALIAEKLGQSLAAAKKRFFIYRAALVWTVLMMGVRGTLEVLRVELSRGLDMAISGLAGLGHIVFGAALISLVLLFLKWSRERDDGRTAAAVSR